MDIVHAQRTTMLDLHLIRQAPEALVHLLHMRGWSAEAAQEKVQEVLYLDARHNQDLQALEALRCEKNTLDTELKQKKGALSQEEKQRCCDLKSRISAQEEVFQVAESALRECLMLLPNWLLPCVPRGLGEGENVEIFRWCPPERAYTGGVRDGAETQSMFQNAEQPCLGDPWDDGLDPINIGAKRGGCSVTESKSETEGQEGDFAKKIGFLSPEKGFFASPCPALPPYFQDHVALGQALDGMDFAQAAKVSGSRFVYLRGDLARLERALAQWMLDVHTQRYGFTEMSVPYLVLPEAMYGAGQLPKFAQDVFFTTNGHYLIPTGEVSLVNWVAQRLLDPKDLPVTLVACSPCFRSEAGSSGRDTHGMLRHHQFTKVELVVICQPEQADLWHERMTRQSQWLLQQLRLPYRRVLLCAGDTGATSSKTYDLEVWMPGEGKYREIASCSQCGSYQSRRMKTRHKMTKVPPTTLNASGLPTGRTLAALLENHQDSQGCLAIPEVLRPYMGGKTVLHPKEKSV